MHLNDLELKNRAQWQKAGIRLPTFDREQMISSTKREPVWVHFGAGNIFRAFPAALQQELLNGGFSSKGIIAVEGYDEEIIDRMYRPHDNLSLLVTLKSNGTIDKTVIGSIAESVKADSGLENEFARLKEIFRCESLQMASFTITEKGYRLTRENGDFLPDVQTDFSSGPSRPKSYIGKLTALCYERYIHGAKPLALVSMDNCSHNGAKLYAAVHTFAEKWVENGKTEKEFLTYLEDPSRVSFPWSMIDKITPRPDDGVKAMLEKAGFEDTKGEITAKNTYVAPFVNSEETQYLVIEDQFPNGRPPLEKAGVIFTDRATVEKTERMKVCTCLNPLHTALAIFGCLLGYTKINDEMKDKDLVGLIRRIGYQEGLPVVIDPGILSPKAFLDEVINVRLPNPFLPDTPQRIVTDTSLKIPIRYGETIKAYLSSDKLETGNLKMILLTLAGWCRYLMGVDDSGNSFDRSPDPMLNKLTVMLSSVKLGQKGPFHEVLRPILSNKEIFGVNLYEAGLGNTVEADFAELVSSRGAVRATLKKHLSNG
jgi:fructuronate reductase